MRSQQCGQVEQSAASFQREPGPTPPASPGCRPEAAPRWAAAAVGTPGPPGEERPLAASRAEASVPVSQHFLAAQCRGRVGDGAWGRGLGVGGLRSGVG